MSSPEQARPAVQGYVTTNFVPATIANSVVADTTASTPQTNTQVLGKGSYGCVFEPALSNKNNTNTVREFPGEVTKVFYQKSAYNKAIRNKNILPLLGPNAVYPISGYKRKIVASNIARKTRRNCNIPYNDGETMYGIHMPNLGISIASLPRNIIAIDMLRQLPYKTLFGQFRKLMKQILNLRERHFVHGDVRETNILIHPEHGNMTLIDFDWLMPWNEFKKTYPGSFYSCPPESVLLHQDTFFVGPVITPNAFIGSNIIRKNIVNWHMPYERIIETPGILSRATKTLWRNTLDKQYIARLSYILLSNTIETSPADAYNQFTNKLFMSFDSYGLALALIIVLDTLYPNTVPFQTSASDNVDARIIDSASTYYRPGKASDIERAEFIVILIRIYRALYSLFSLDVENRQDLLEVLGEVDRALSTDVVAEPIPPNPENIPAPVFNNNGGAVRQRRGNGKTRRRVRRTRKKMH